MSKIDTEFISNRSRVSVGSIKQVVYEHRYFRGLLSESLLPGQLGILHALTVVLDGCVYRFHVRAIIMGLRLRPGRISNPLTPYASKRFTYELTEIWVIYVCHPIELDVIHTQ